MKMMKKRMKDKRNRISVELHLSVFTILPGNRAESKTLRIRQRALIYFVLRNR